MTLLTIETFDTCFTDFILTCAICLYIIALWVNLGIFQFICYGFISFLHQNLAVGKQLVLFINEIWMTKILINLQNVRQSVKFSIAHRLLLDGLKQIEQQFLNTFLNKINVKNFSLLNYSCFNLISLPVSRIAFWDYSTDERFRKVYEKSDHHFLKTDFKEQGSFTSRYFCLTFIDNNGSQIIKKEISKGQRLWLECAIYCRDQLLQWSSF